MQQNNLEAYFFSAAKKSNCLENRVAKCHGFGGLIRVNFLEVWGKLFESVIRVFDVWVILPHALQQLSNFTPLYRVTKCHRNGRYICVKVLEVWGKILGE